MLNFDNTRNTASGETNTYTSINSIIDDDATHVGTTQYYGLDVSIDFANTNGTQKATGIKTTITDGDTADMYGLWQMIEDGGTDLYFQSSDITTTDYFSIATKASGETDITTVDGGGNAANLNFNIDGAVNFNTPSVVIADSVSGTLAVQNTTQNATGGALILKNTNGGADGNDGDICGEIQFWGTDDGTPSEHKFGNIQVAASDVTNGQEASLMQLQVAEYDGTVTTGLKLDGDTNADGEIDVTIGAGTASVSTIA